MTRKWAFLLVLITCIIFFRWILFHRDVNLTKQREILFFFRVPKTGSEMTVLLLQWLQGVNRFRHVRLQNTVSHRLNALEQIELRREILDVLSASDGLPVAFDRHIYFTDLQRLYHRTSEVIKVNYFSSLRDPIDRIVSQFYYARVTPRPGIRLPPHLTTNQPPTAFRFQTMEECLEAAEPECSFVTGRHYNLQIPYFCGHDEHCTELNNPRALEQAKSNVRKHFLVVGVLEHLNCTLQVTERKINTFFGSVQQMYYNELLEPKKNKNYGRPKKLRDDLHTALRKNLTMEYLFYSFVTQRLLEQCSEMSNSSLNKIY